MSAADVTWLRDAVYEMYDAYMASDRARADSFIADDVTL